MCLVDELVAGAWAAVSPSLCYITVSTVVGELGAGGLLSHPLYAILLCLVGELGAGGLLSHPLHLPVGHHCVLQEQAQATPYQIQAQHPY